MTIEQQDLEKLKQIHLKHRGVNLTDQEALEMGTNLVNLFRVIAKPIDRPY